MIGLLNAAAVVLVVSGLGKCVAPGGTKLAVSRLGLEALANSFAVRSFGAAEMGIGGSVLLVGGALPAAGLSGVYLFLSMVAWRMLRIAPTQDCGCFGQAGRPISRVHLVLSICCAAGGMAAIRWPQPALPGAVAELARDGVLLAVTLPAMVLLLSWLMYAAMTAAPAPMVAR